jgi:hypothetical protein
MVQKRSQIFPKALVAKLVEHQCAEAFEFFRWHRKFGQIQNALHTGLDQIDDVAGVSH